MNWRSSARTIAICAMMAALLELGKFMLNAVANVEVVTLLILLFSRRFGWKVLPSIAVFVGLEFLFWGFGTWSFCYLYVWPLLAGIGIIFRKQNATLLWALIAGAFGLCFGALCSLTYLVIGGIHFAFTWWTAGIPYDLIHCGANFVLTLILWKPLDRLLARLA
ncbi:MAG: hypothetical protein J6P31_03310 [Oscillospiraceae bacterium]|nr:hypothetical protein [Oscillospiraceae bacterium]